MVDKSDKLNLGHLDIMNDEITYAEVYFVRKKLKKDVGSIGINNNCLLYLDKYKIDIILALCFTKYFIMNLQIFLLSKGNISKV